MSSMRNAVQRRPHRERAQPLERRRLGLLEKHKDYSARAKDYKKKKATLKNLRQKAADRNEDEFYHAMLSRKGPGSKLVSGGKNWNGTAQGDRGNKSLDMETVRVLKTQDLGYVRTMRQVVRKEVERMEERVVMMRGLDKLDEEEDEEGEEMSGDDEFDIDFEKSSKLKAPRKIIFMDDESEREQFLDQQTEFDFNKPPTDEPKATEEEADKATELRRLKGRLVNAKKKLQILIDAEEELNIQRAKMAKTATSGGETRRGQKIKVRTRKR